MKTLLQKLLVLLVVGGGWLPAVGYAAAAVTAATASAASEAWEIDPVQLVAKAREQVGVTVGYDSAYRALEYPGGDVPLATGVCCDVVVRALRGFGVDLQREVHEDMRAHFAAYPQNWGLRRPDRNIDHRRVPNLRVFFKRRGCEVPLPRSVGNPVARFLTGSAGDFLPGDIVTWRLPGNLPHIGFVSDRKTAAGVPLVIHNIGGGAREEDALFTYEITGHYRVAKKAVADR